MFWLVTRLTLHHFNNKRDPSRQLPPVHCGFSLSDRLYVSGRPFSKFRSSSPTFDSTLVLDRSSMSALIIGDRSSPGRRRTASRSLSVTRVVRSNHTSLAFGRFDQSTKAMITITDSCSSKKRELSDDESRAGSFGKMDVGSGSVGDGDIVEDMDSQLAFPMTAPLCSMSAPENPVDSMIRI